MQERRFIRVFILVPALVTLFFVYEIFRPFLQPIALSIILVSLCYPAYRWILKHVGRRENVASLITCLLIMFLVVLPVALLVVTLAGQVNDVYNQVHARVASGEFDNILTLKKNPYLADVKSWLERYVNPNKIDLVGGISSGLQQLSLYLIRNSPTILEGFAGVVGQFVIVMITMFFLFRDGPRLTGELRKLSPLGSRHEELLTRKFREITRATVLGTLVTALAQGVAGGFVFWILGTGNALFWGTATGFVSMVPVVGTSAVWFPWVIFFLLSGAYLKAVALLVLSIFFVGLIDNVLRPLLIEGQAGMHTLVVFFALLGGGAYFGILGLVFGPVLVSLFLAFLELYRTEFRAELVKPDS